MAKNKTDFVIQAALLDKFTKMEDLSKDSVGVSVVIRKLKENPDLLRYFLGQSPSPAWANLFYENGFFSNPPNVIELENGFQTPYWGMSAYLKSIAKGAPEIVEKVVSEIVTNNPVIYEDFLDALAKLPASNTIIFDQKIKFWLESKFIQVWGLGESAIKLMTHWAQAGFISQAVDVMDLILRPASKATGSIDNYYIGAEGKPRLEMDYVQPDLWSVTIPEFGRLAYSETLKLLERKLLECISVEMSAKHIEVDFTSGMSYWWRQTIADHEQNYGTDYKDKILVAFRNLLDKGAKENPYKVRQELEFYLKNNVVILKRVAVYIIANNSDLFVDFAWELLEKKEFHSDLKFHNDYFYLLNLSYSFLSQAQQEKILFIIKNGPSEEEIDNSRKFALESKYDVEKYISDRKNLWIRDRLWVIKQYLTPDIQSLLDTLCKSYGQPDHPGFLAWSSGAFWIRDVSPKPKDQLLTLAPDELIEFVRNWQEDRRSQDFGPEQVSLRGLGETVAEIILDFPEKYQDIFEHLHLTPPDISMAIFSLAQQRSKEGKIIPWAKLIRLIYLCSESSIGLIEDKQGIYSASRLEGIRLLEHGLLGKNGKKVLIPGHLFERVKEVVQIYLNDSHPNINQDRPEEDMMGHRDPLTTALNSVRPIAFICFMEFIKHTELHRDWGEVQGLWVKEQLAAKLDKSLDSSLAVHSVFGRYYWLLSKWDNDWLQSVIAKIFPLGEDSDSVDYFLAAWDSFILYNRPGRQTINALRSEYNHSVELISQGKTTKTHLDIPGRTFMHIFLDYLWNPYDVKDKSGLVHVFMDKCNDEVRSQGIQMLLELIRNTDKPDVNELWEKTRVFWLWRANEFSLTRYPGEMEKEMERFSLLATHIPLAERLEDIQILIKPFFSAIKDGFIWRNLEKLLSLRVDSEPVLVAKNYRLMHEEISNSMRARLIYYAEEADTIIYTAIKNEHSRKDILRVIDLIFRNNGNEKYRRLYEEYS